MDSTYATICSMLPYSLQELKPGLNPKAYFIEKAEEGSFSLTIIPNDISYNINPDPLADAKQTRFIRVPVPAIECARSIIGDYVSALLAIEPPDKLPGLFAVVGDWTDKKEFGTKHLKMVMDYRNRQNGWFKNLVDIADDTWSRTHSPVGISDIQKDACRLLGYRRDWLNPLPFEEQNKCPVCMNAINLGALKCVACGHVIDKLAYERVLAGK